MKNKIIAIIATMLISSVSHGAYLITYDHAIASSPTSVAYAGEFVIAQDAKQLASQLEKITYDKFSIKNNINIRVIELKD